MQLSAKELARVLNGTVEGDPEVVVSRPSKIEEGGAGTISFLGNAKYEHYAYHTTASILLVDQGFEARQAIPATIIRVANVYTAIAQLLELFGSAFKPQAGISEKASIDPTATLGEGVTVGPFAVIEAGASIGAGSVISSQAYIGPDVKIGSQVLVHPGARILKDCQIGDRCIIHGNAVIGSDGFGFAPRNDGSYQKIAHVGNVIIENEVEIGANTTIDRGTMGSTIIRTGVKLDNLIQVGHNVEIGEHTVIAAQTGIAGSTRIGRYCRIGGQVGFVGHIQVADGTQIQAQSGVASPIEHPKTAVFGSPAIPYSDYIRAYAVFKKLPALYKQVHHLERIINNNSIQKG